MKVDMLQQLYIKKRTFEVVYKKYPPFPLTLPKKKILITIIT